MTRSPIHAFTEERFDKLQLAGSSSAIEMRKDGFLSQSARSKGLMQLASLEEESMTIYSTYLLNILPQVVGYYPTSKVTGGKLQRGVPSITLNKRN